MKLQIHVLADEKPRDVEIGFQRRKGEGYNVERIETHSDKVFVVEVPEDGRLVLVPGAEQKVQAASPLAQGRPSAPVKK